jgi:hypothetical protein
LQPTENSRNPSVTDDTRVFLCRVEFGGVGWICHKFVTISTTVPLPGCVMLLSRLRQRALLHLYNVYLTTFPFPIQTNNFLLTKPTKSKSLIFLDLTDSVLRNSFAPACLV